MASYRESFIVRIACDPPALFWTGIGPLPVTAEADIPADAIALGAGHLVNIPDYQQLIYGTAERREVVCDGVSAESRRLAMEDAESGLGAAVLLGRSAFDADWQ